MSETFPAASVDAMPAVIEEIVRTMQVGSRTLRLDQMHSGTDAYIPETATDPPGVNFRTLAHEVVAEGLFKPHPRISRDDLEGNLMPQELLDLPYPNGPATIMLGGDVPLNAMEAVRGGIIRANRIVLKAELLGVYFHRRFANEHPLLSPGIINKNQAFTTEYFLTPDSDAPSDAISFQTEGVPRSTVTRQLFTEAEKLAAVDLAAAHPELVVAISAYQGTVIDYLCELGVAIADETNSGKLPLSQPEVALFAGFINEWRTNNFYHELLPSIAIFLHNAKLREPEKRDDELITPELLHDAVEFIVQNGGFRKYVKVAAEVAADHKERTNKFVCPAANIIREHLVDGRLLHKIYGHLREQVMDGDSLTQAMVGNVRYTAENEHASWYSYDYGDD